MKTKIRQMTRFLTGAKEQFTPKYICVENGKEKEMPCRSVKFKVDQLGRYFEYTQSQVGMSSIALG